MARLIAETPVLSGSDARRFEEAISNVQPLSSVSLPKVSHNKTIDYDTDISNIE